MACYHPIPAHQDGPGGKVTLWPASAKKRGSDLNSGISNHTMELPCGTCLGCKTARAAQWASRCDHEARQWENNIFVTLTYDDAHLPPEGHLDAKALTLFFKRLRKRRTTRDKRLRSDQRGNIKYFACGEYGGLYDRPHYHACLFNVGFADKYRVGKDLFQSGLLAELWPNGRADFGEYTGGGANYIAQYTLKKQGKNNDHDADGVWRPAPFLRVSLKPAVGLAWLDKYKEDLQHGYLVSNGHRTPIPRTYRERLKLSDPALAESIAISSATHRKQSNYGGDNNTTERREAAETIHKRLKQLTERRTL